MSNSRSPFPIIRAFLLTAALIARVDAQQPKLPEPPSRGRPFPSEEELKEFLKPQGPLVIPDDPPPHEGAMIDLPYIAEPSDHLTIEVLEALPGRPITGQRLIRPDGTVDLGFYGTIHVRGLTLEQIKTRLILHLRPYINDEILGLTVVDISTPGPEPSSPTPGAPMPGGLRGEPQPGQLLPIPSRSPFDIGIPEEAAPARANPSGVPSSRDRLPPLPPVRPEIIPPPLPPVRPEIIPPGEDARPSAKEDEPRRAPRQNTDSMRSRRRPRRPRPAERRAVEGPSRPAEPEAPGVSILPAPPEPRETLIKPKGNQSVPEGISDIPTMPKEKHRTVHPADSDRVMVDVSEYNSSFYYVLGYVARPGSIAFTGHETVLDAILHAGGLAPGADMNNVQLVRPIPGGTSKVYRIDLKAMVNDPKANYQIFPGDRLLVDATEMVKQKDEIDRVANSLEPVLKSMKLHADMVRSLNRAASSGKAGNRGGLTPEQRDRILKDWTDLWWKTLSKPGGATLDEKTFREMLERSLNPPGSGEGK
jgi:protein involved in polysaccharide export with SLBB domain